MHTKSLVRSHDATELFLRRDLTDNARAVFVLVHGLGEHCERYDYVTEQLNAFGYNVYRFDHRGHGRSGGARGYLADFNEFIDDTHLMVRLAQAENPTLPVFMLGHSMGGFITAAYGVKYPDVLRGQVLTGPCITLLPAFAPLRDEDIEPLDFMPNALSDVICRDRGVVEDYQTDHLVLMDFTKQMMKEVFVNGTDWLCANIAHYRYPCLIMHGEADQIVPVSNSHYLHDNGSSPDKTLKVWPELFHEILNEREEKDQVLAEIRTWADARI
ncbi:alpha/beta hydrolase [Pseudodesulfovibrio tunisiensis]|uniref:alpha/beta hydrolase n=1 Tax=Pseudodesulfovibrio tunisiensis TaxID=463192 RepID=UPI001FB4D66B|nr:alpha/beta hydrolase [Pseudodesulfovibrio tunisiensis]